MRRRIKGEGGRKPPGPVDPRQSWTRLAPDRFVAATGAPRLEIVTISRTGQVGLVRDHGHAFVRLVDAQGGVRSVGFFPDESMAASPELLPGRRLPGMYLSPDKYDRIDWRPVVTPVALTQERFDALVATIEGWQARCRDKGVDFDLPSANCVGFVVDVARLAGVEAQAQIPPTDFLLPLSPAPLRKILTALRDAAPRRLRAAGTNLVFLLGGGLFALRRRWTPEQGDDGAEPLARLQGGLAIAPMFSSPLDALRRERPFLHVKALRAWQLSSLNPQQGELEPAREAEPPDRGDHDPAGPGGDLEQLLPTAP
jgi:hypothetical protein